MSFFFLVLTDFVKYVDCFFSFLSPASPFLFRAFLTFSLEVCIIFIIRLHEKVWGIRGLSGTFFSLL